ncbi:MAG: polyphosphate kinase 1 [Deltaproteobacteria bacterium]|jgi:polyphosphate kinase|nr:polyphosphate kinase 1 [Deltaproteobacteria bacterium]
MTADLRAASLYLNRELSWLEFNRRVLATARRADVPPLERLKFVAIAAANLDEFFMVRVGGLERALNRRDVGFEVGPDGLHLHELHREVWQRAPALVSEIAQTLDQHVVPELQKHGIRFVQAQDLSDEQREDLHEYYRREVHPCLTPIAIDPTHPFPMLRNGSINLALRIVAPPKAEEAFEAPEGELLALVQVPSVLSRFVPLSGTDQGYRFMALEEVIALFVQELFPGYRILESTPFRLIRASDLEVDEEEVEDLLSTIQDELRRRDRGEPVRLDLPSRASDELSLLLTDRIGLRPQQALRNPGFVAKAALMRVYGQINRPELRDEPYQPVANDRLRYLPTLFRSIAERDVLLHHPYEAFRHVVDFLDQAASDPDVVAIKQTLYRTSGDSPIVRALVRAAERGKQVTALVELKARFDEANNIAWAKALEEAGAHVVYGLIGLKTHSKLLLVTRREGSNLRRYLHLATGNYNPSTANLYTDLGLFTAREDLTADAMHLFNVLTGYAELPKMNHLVVAPFTLRQHLLQKIQREIEHQKAGRPAGIKAKMNALVDGEIISALYRASQAGVPIELMVRGICCLCPGVPGVSETIRVSSIIDRFLEHARIVWWKNGGEDEVYLSSADWMPRNLNRRIEVSFPILDPELRRRVIDNILTTELSDNVSRYTLLADGQYQPPELGERVPVRAQGVFMSEAKNRAPQARTTVRPELSMDGTRLSPAVRAAEAQRRRRRPGEA